MDIQEALKVLQFRLRRKVRYRPVVRRDGGPMYLVDGKLCAEREILERVGALQPRRAGTRRQERWRCKQAPMSGGDC